MQIFILIETHLADVGESDFVLTVLAARDRERVRAVRDRRREGVQWIAQDPERIAELRTYLAAMTPEIGDVSTGLDLRDEHSRVAVATVDHWLAGRGLSDPEARAAAVSALAAGLFDEPSRGAMTTWSTETVPFDAPGARSMADPAPEILD